MRSRLMYRFSRAWRLIALVSFVLAIAIPIGILLGFRFISTSSVPKGLWWVHAGPAKRGSYVLVCLPPRVALEGRRAGYLFSGFCPGRVLPVMKRVIALAGDRVTVSRTGLSVNGRAIIGSARLSRDSRGRPIMTTVVASTYRVAPNVIWLLGDWFKSWDSRYYGGVSSSRIIGVGMPLLVSPAGS